MLENNASPNTTGAAKTPMPAAMPPPTTAPAAARPEGKTPAKEENEEKEDLSPSNNEILQPNFDTPKPKHSEQAAPAQTPDLVPKTSPAQKPTAPTPKPVTPTPKPSPAPTPTPARAPIPMATP